MPEGETKKEEPSEPLTIDVLFSSEYGLIKQVPGIKELVALRDGLFEYRKRRQLWNLKAFFDSFAQIEPNEKTREEFYERFKNREDRDEILDVLPEFLSDRNAQVRLRILGRLMYALVSEKLSIERFYDLTEILEDTNTRALSFLSIMANAGFEMRGSIDEYSEEASLLIAIGIASRENDMLRVNSLGRELHSYAA